MSHSNEPSLTSLFFLLFLLCLTSVGAEEASDWENFPEISLSSMPNDDLLGLIDLYSRLESQDMVERIQIEMGRRGLEVDQPAALVEPDVLVAEVQPPEMNETERAMLRERLSEQSLNPVRSSKMERRQEIRTMVDDALNESLPKEKVSTEKETSVAQKRRRSSKQGFGSGGGGGAKVPLAPYAIEEGGFREIDKLERWGYFSKTSFRNEDQGSRLTTQLDIRSPEFGRGWRLLAGGRYDRSDDAANRLGEKVRRDSWESTLGIEKSLTSHTYVQISGGASNGEGIYGAGLRGEYDNGSYWSVNYSGNGLVRDGVLLEALEAREQRGDMTLGLPLGERLQFSTAFFGRSIDLKGKHLGDGYGGHADLAWTVVNGSGGLPQITLTYRAQYETLKGTEYVDALDDLLISPFHQQGLLIGANGQIGQLAYGVRGGVYYDVPRNGMAYSGEAFLEYQFTDLTSIYGQVGYYSHGRGATRAGEIMEASLGLSVAY